MAQLADHVLAYGKDKPPKGKKKVVGMHIKKAKGGYHVTHEHEMHEPEEHVIGGDDAMADLLSHMEKHLG